MVESAPDAALQHDSLRCSIQDQGCALAIKSVDRLVPIGEMEGVARRITMSTKARIPAQIKAHVFAAFDCCAACGTWDADECGHIVAESKGGQMIAENFVRLCGSCNRKQANVNVVFAAFATITIEPAIIISRRAYWASYCSAASGKAKVKAYKPQ